MTLSHKRTCHLEKLGYGRYQNSQPKNKHRFVSLLSCDPHPGGLFWLHVHDDWAGTELMMLQSQSVLSIHKRCVTDASVRDAIVGRGLVVGRYR